MQTIEHPIDVILQSRFYGIISKGLHNSDGSAACVLEAAHAAIGDEWSDAPDKWPDIRPLNDAAWPNAQVRTENMLLLLKAIWDWYTWSFNRKNHFSEIITFKTIKEILPKILPEPHKSNCGSVQTLVAAADAASAAADAASAAARAASAAASAADAARAVHAADAAYAAYAAADAADVASTAAARAADAAYAAADAADVATEILKLACTIWINAAQETIND